MPFTIRAFLIFFLLPATVHAADPVYVPPSSGFDTAGCEEKRVKYMSLEKAEQKCKADQEIHDAAALARAKAGKTDPMDCANLQKDFKEALKEAGGACGAVNMPDVEECGSTVKKECLDSRAEKGDSDSKSSDSRSLCPLNGADAEKLDTEVQKLNKEMEKQ